MRLPRLPRRNDLSDAAIDYAEDLRESSPRSSTRVRGSRVVNPCGALAGMVCAPATRAVWNNRSALLESSGWSYIFRVLLGVAPVDSLGEDLSARHLKGREPLAPSTAFEKSWAKIPCRQGVVSLLCGIKPLAEFPAHRAGRNETIGGQIGLRVPKLAGLNAASGSVVCGSLPRNVAWRSRRRRPPGKTGRWPRSGTAAPRDRDELLRLNGCVTAEVQAMLRFAHRARPCSRRRDAIC